MNPDPSLALHGADGHRRGLGRGRHPRPRRRRRLVRRGAVAGDAVSYWIGRRAGSGAFRAPIIRRRRRVIARARLFFRRYGAASVYLCRFLGPVRAFVPLIAVMTAMNQLRFKVAYIGSAIVWVTVMLAPGYLAAKGAQQAHLESVWIVIGIVSVVCIAVLARRLLKAPRPSGPGRRPAQVDEF
ncbi:MAG: hypothetical protein EON95_05540 [Caulobacteraceae bacterium]|nr:MAG: hypothetical protein EON95_05540 [Caulobacteraceae bacterium]